VYDHNRVQTLGTLLIAHQIDPTIDLCGPASEALQDPALFDAHVGFTETNGGTGWHKPVAQAFQGAVFAVGGYDACE
jgi:hypothetical protein